MDNEGGATKVSSIIQFVVATAAFSTGFFAVLETMPTPPLFDLQFIYNTRLTLAEAGVVFGAVGLLLTMLSFRAPGRWQWVLAASLVLAGVGLSGGLFAVTMTSWAG